VISLECVFTKPKLSDAKEAMRYLNALVDEGTYIATQKRKTLKDEKVWINELVKKIKDGLSMRARILQR
jgi:hypothetical protein